MTESLVRYDAMLNAIAECHRIDEVKDFRDKALALQMYARQARNLDAERKAAGVRIRAEIRAGELLKEQAANGRRATRGGSNLQRESLPQLKDLGISETQSSRWQALAEVPKGVIDAALQDPIRIPTTSGLLNSGKREPKLNDEALWLWGRLREFEQRGYFDADPQYLFDEMTDAMQTDFCRIVPLMEAFFATCERICDGK